MSRAQSHVVGVALLLAASAVALGTLTMGVGELMESRAADADAQRVATGLDEAIRPRQTTGFRSDRIRFTDGRLETVPREVRVYRNGSTVGTYATMGLRYESSGESVSFVGSGIVRRAGDSSWLVREPAIAGSEARGVLLVGLTHLEAEDVAVSAAGTTSVPILTNVSHAREDLGTGSFEVGIETTAIDAFRRYFEERGIPTVVQDVDGDGVASVRARFPGDRQAYLVHHRLSLEVGHG
ncbi:MAG: type IV pilin [Haloarculaceae archaeon]